MNPILKKMSIYSLSVINSHIFAGTNGATYFSTDEGNSWSLMDSTRANCFTANNTYLFMGTNKGVKRYPLSKFNK